jgi:hypothetical protein
MNYTESSEVRGCHTNTTVLEFNEKFQCTAEEFYRVMTEIEVRVKKRERMLKVVGVRGQCRSQCT